MHLKMIWSIYAFAGGDINGFVVLIEPETLLCVHDVGLDYI